MKETSIEHTRIDLDSDYINTVSDEIRLWYESYKDVDYKGIKIFDNKIYVLIALGEKKSGGYNVRINKIKKTKMHVKVYYSILEPLDYDTMIATFVYPCDLVVISLLDLNINDIDKITMHFEMLETITDNER